MLNFRLTQDQLDLQQKARTFALKEVLPVAWYYDEKDELPLKVIRKAFDAGMIGIDIPKEFGGQGLSLLESSLITEEIAAACPGLATSIFDSSLGMEPSLPLLEDLALHREHDPGDGQKALMTGSVWRCRICGYVHYNEMPPDECPYCFFPKTAFKKSQ